MNVLHYLADFDNWSLWWLTALVALLVIYMLKARASMLQTFLFALALGFMYVVFGSPLSAVKDLGLHSLGMIQQIILFMIVPVLLLMSLPQEALEHGFLKKLKGHLSAKNYFILTWLIGAFAMWGGHFISAAILSSKTGLAICGVSFSRNELLSFIPDNLVLMILFVAGILFALPIFHPDPAQRISPLKRVAYLFTSCVSCTVLGLYVVFSASAASIANTVQSIGIFPSPLPWSLHTDQELAGMIMWVPGCLIYVLTSIGIMLAWYDDEEKQGSMVLPVMDGHSNK